jgi:Protein of unknown function (DUF2794)
MDASGSQDTEAIVPFPGRKSQQVTFDRKELGLILNLYGFYVALGEWRDYALDFAAEQAMFSIFRRASEVPLYAIVKRPQQRHKQGMYAVIAQDGRILKRGHELDQVLRVLARKPNLTHC